MLRAVHSDRIERWLGADLAGRLSRNMAGWHGPPIGLHGVPGNVLIGADGDFCGDLRAGFEAHYFDRALDVAKRLRRAARIATSGARRNQLNAGFASLNDLISEASSGGKRQDFTFLKNGPTGVANVTSTLWRVGAQPAAGGAGSAAPGGRACTSSTTGAFPYTNPTSGDTLHFVRGDPQSSVAGNTLLLYDRLFDVAKTMNSTATEAVSGTPSRYQNNTGAQADSAAGNFLFIEVGGTALAATAHNWTVCTYTDESGNAGATLPSVTGNASAITDRLDMPASTWFCPLATGDSGVKALTQMQCSALVATGAINFVIGHPIVWMPCPIASMTCIIDGISTAFNLARIFDSAALSFREVNKPSTTAAVYTGTFTAVAG